jgi:uncharacterized protein (TIGR02996 family)
MSRDKARGFLEDIVAHPDEDAPRLIFADWLEDEGDSARAEFIRVQIERAHLPEWDARQVSLRLRELALMNEHGRKWKRGLPPIKGGGWGSGWGRFRRGFVATAAFSSLAVLGSDASVYWAAAPVEAVSVGWPRRREAIGSIAPIPGLRELHITGRLIDPDEVARLADAPLLSTLRVLNINRCSLGIQGFRRLAKSPHLGNLRVLRVPHNYIGNEGIGAMCGAVSLTSLEELDLSEMGGYGRYGEDPIIQASGLETLTTWPGMTRLRSLTLSGNDVGCDGLRTLLRSQRATGLKKLVLSRNGLTDQAMQEFVSARSELQLDVLELDENLLGDRGVMYLANAPCLRDLKVLELDRCELPLSAARQLVKAPFLGTLRRLNVSHTLFSRDGLRALLDKNPPELHTLRMADTALDDEAVRHLADSPASDTLLEVSLAQNGLGDQAAQALTKSKHLRNLLVLLLDSDRISKKAAAALTRSPLGKRLAVLETIQAPIYDEIRRQFDENPF